MHSFRPCQKVGAIKIYNSNALAQLQDIGNDDNEPATDSSKGWPPAVPANAMQHWNSPSTLVTAAQLRDGPAAQQHSGSRGEIWGNGG